MSTIFRHSKDRNPKLQNKSKFIPVYLLAIKIQERCSTKLISYLIQQCVAYKQDNGKGYTETWINFSQKVVVMVLLV